MAATFSGLAADLWPGNGIDKVRFVELWVLYAEKPEATWVSVPLLSRYLRDHSRIAEADELEATRPELFKEPESTKVFLGRELDMPAETVRSLCSSIPLRDIRLHSYPALFYEQVRCYGSHEYRMGENASARKMTTQESAVSYLNQVHSLPPHKVRRLIHFHALWLHDMISALARRVDSLPTPTVPTTWWLDAVI